MSQASQRKFDVNRPRPCPFCGQIVSRVELSCSRCQIRLDAGTLTSLKSIVGPWFVLDYRNPTAPGVTWAKLQAMIERGGLKKTSVVRGPTSAGLWRYAQDTPIVATALGMCWACHEEIGEPQAQQCPTCNTPLNRLTDTSGLLAAMLSHGPTTAGEEGEQAAEPDADKTDNTPLRQAARRFEGGFVEIAGSSQIRRLAGVLLIALACVTAFFLAMGYGRDLRQSNIPLPAPAAELPAIPAPVEPAPNETPVAVPEVPEAAPTNPPAAVEPATPSAEVAVSPNTTGELFPEKTPAAPAVTTSAPTPAAKPAPAGAKVVLDEAERQRRSAVAMLSLAEDAAQRGDVAGAAKLLAATTVHYDPAVLPAGLPGRLQAFQQRSASQPEPKRDAILKQWNTAQELFEQAKSSEKAGQYAAAGGFLVQIVKQLPSQAWPNEMPEMLLRVEEQLAPDPPADAGRASPRAPADSPKAPPAGTTPGRGASDRPTASSQPSFYGVGPG